MAHHKTTKVIRANNLSYNAGFKRAVECGMKDAVYVDALETKLILAKAEIKKLKGDDNGT